jgi:citrate lyase subunit beta/citryl-CoA lyase
MISNELVDFARSALFVPGTKPERFGKARNSGADLAIFDLEDSVLDLEKDLALGNVVAALIERFSGAGIVVRVNSDRLAIELPALLPLVALNPDFVGILLPKVENPADIPSLPEGLSGIAIIESSLGLRNAYEIASHPSITKLAFGGMDFAAETGSQSPIVHDYARVQILTASLAAGISRPWDSPSGHIEDLSQVGVESEHAKALGFGGRMAIHPAQIDSIHKAFEVTQAEIEWAEAILKVDTGAGKVNGQMVDRPIMLQAENILKRAKPKA